VIELNIALSCLFLLTLPFSIFRASSLWFAVAFATLKFQKASPFLQNKSLTNMDETENILTLQGVGWFKRKAIRYGTITLHIKHYRVDPEQGQGDQKIEKIDIDQTISGGIPGTSEDRTLIWKEKENDDHLFGPVIGKSRRVRADELDVGWLKEGWTDDTYEHGLVQAWAESDTPKSGTTWIGNQVSMTMGVHHMNDIY